MAEALRSRHIQFTINLSQNNESSTRRCIPCPDKSQIHTIAQGTVVNGKAIQGRHELHHEDELRLHDIIFRVKRQIMYRLNNLNKVNLDKPLLLHDDVYTKMVLMGINAKQKLLSDDPF